MSKARLEDEASSFFKKSMGDEAGSAAFYRPSMLMDRVRKPDPDSLIRLELVCHGFDRAILKRKQ